MSLSARDRARAAAIAAFGAPLLASLGASYRFDTVGAEHVSAAQQLGQPIYTCWHGRILGGALYFRGRRLVSLASLNFDGEWIAQLLTRLGYGIVRGSTSRGASRALRELRRTLHDRPIAITVDGPRGPARVAQPGALWLSKVSGSPVLPFHVEASRHWTLGSWDEGQIPKPFSAVAVAFAPPFVVARESADSDLSVACRRLEGHLTDCEAACRARLAARAER